MRTHQQRLGLFLQHSKKALGFSRQEIATSLGISYAYYGHLETGRRPIPVKVTAQLDKKFNLPTGTVEKLVRCARTSDVMQKDLLSDLLLDVTQLIVDQSDMWAAMEYRHHIIPILKVP
jgi:transcriptional regulator with XRE-family HTH domain